MRLKQVHTGHPFRDKAMLAVMRIVMGHAPGVVRTLLYAQGGEIRKLVKKISTVRQSLDNSNRDMDQGLERLGVANLVPADGNSIAFSRSTRQVLNIVYGKVDATEGLFFPNGLNGAIK